MDNSFNRHNVCSHKKCLRRNDGTVTMTCKYNFPHEISDKSKIIRKYYDDQLISVDHTNMSNDS